MPNKPNRPPGEMPPPFHYSITSAFPSDARYTNKANAPTDGQADSSLGPILRNKPNFSWAAKDGRGAAALVKRAKQSQFVPEGQEWARPGAAGDGPIMPNKPNFSRAGRKGRGAPRLGREPPARDQSCQTKPIPARIHRDVRACYNRSYGDFLFPRGSWKNKANSLDGLRTAAFGPMYSGGMAWRRGMPPGPRPRAGL
jgi:hypothetical protein